jgi:glycosyltransferase involved in cell wall biosynthesis
MHGGAINLAKEFNKLEHTPELVIASDMVDLPLFMSLTNSKNYKTAVYFHENQLTYPWSPKDRDVKRGGDAHYKFINYKSALVADKVYFNSSYHMDGFLKALPLFLKSFPDNQNLETVEIIKQKSEVLYLGTNLSSLEIDFKLEKNITPLILWNHRWEYDKNPDDFFNALYTIKSKNIDFKLAVLGEEFDMVPDCFHKAKEILADNIIHFGYVDSKQDYAKWLWKADILPVTSIHDYFGISVVEAIYCKCKPLLPNRLAYPEHVNKEIFSENFYDSQNEFIEKLENLLKNVSSPPSLMRESVKRYQWENIINVYDQKFINL